MSESDLDPVLEIEQTSFNNPWHRISFLNELSNKYSHNFVLKLENSSQTYQIIAYLCCRLIIDEIHILKIAVRPGQRHKGIAFKFFNQCLETVGQNRVRSAILEVRQNNVAAIGLYKKTGFYIEAQLPGYYSDTHEDAILMRKTFKGGMINGNENSNQWTGKNRKARVPFRFKAF